MPENESSDLDWLSMAGKSFRNPLLFRLPTNGQMVDWLKVWFVYLAQRMPGILDLFFFLNFSSSSLFRLLLFCPDSYFSQSERIQCYTKARKKTRHPKGNEVLPGVFQTANQADDFCRLFCHAESISLFCLLPCAFFLTFFDFLCSGFYFSWRLKRKAENDRTPGQSA